MMDALFDFAACVVLALFAVCAIGLAVILWAVIDELLRPRK